MFLFLKQIDLLKTMIPLIYIGLLSFGTSFTLSFTTTYEYLRLRLETEINKLNESKTKIKFDKNVNVRLIESKRELSHNSLNKLWYNKNDYEKFKYDFVKSNSF